MSRKKLEELKAAVEDHGGEPRALIPYIVAAIEEAGFQERPRQSATKKK